MRNVVGEVLPLAVVVTVSPINIIAAILLLFSKEPVANAVSYLAGFVIGVGAVLGGATALAGTLDVSASSGRSRGAAAFLLVLGVLLVVVAVRKFHNRPGPDDVPSTPKWMDGIEGFGPGRSLAAGVAVGVLNPKNMAVSVAAAVTIALANLSAGEQVGVIAIYVAIASLGVAAPIIAVVVLGERSEGVLDDWKSWLDRNSAATMAVIYLLFGVILIGKGIAGT
jgi:Sap, sulfolipid-1-addressing protein